jgi:hypothetical protein
MAWGDPAVTRLRRQADKSINYAVGVNTPTTLEHVGLLKSIRLIFRASVTLTAGGGSVTKDKQGPWNILSNILIRVSGLDSLFQVSGWGAYLIDLVSFTNFAPDSPGGAVTNQNPASDVFNFPSATGTLNFALDLPFTVPLLGFEDLGLWLIQNETVNMEIIPTFANLGGTAALLVPYILAGGATAAVTAGNIAVWRQFYGVPASASDMPPLGYVHQWEEQYDTVAGTQYDVQHQRGGVFLRILHQVIDADSVGDGSNVLNGLLAANLSNMQFKYDANDTPFDEDPYQILSRQRELYQRDLPQGVFTEDFFSATKTLQDSYNTENYINIKTHFNFAKSLISGSYIRSVRERLLPVVVNTAG